MNDEPPVEPSPSIIEDYRGPLREQIRQREELARLQATPPPPAIVPPPIVEHTLTLRERMALWLAAQRDWLRLTWWRLTSPFRTADVALNNARRGLALQGLSLLVGIGAQLLPLSLRSSLGDAILLTVLILYFLGLTSSLRALMLYRRSTRPRLVLTFGLLGLVVLVSYIIWYWFAR